MKFNNSYSHLKSLLSKVCFGTIFIRTGSLNRLRKKVLNHTSYEFLELQSDKKEPKKKRKKSNKEMANAPDPVTALENSSKLGNRLNMNVLPTLFQAEDKLIKKIKTE